MPPLYRLPGRLKSAVTGSRSSVKNTIKPIRSQARRRKSGRFRLSSGGASTGSSLHANPSQCAQAIVRFRSGRPTACTNEALTRSLRADNSTDSREDCFQAAIGREAIRKSALDKAGKTGRGVESPSEHCDPVRMEGFNLFRDLFGPIQRGRCKETDAACANESGRPIMDEAEVYKVRAPRKAPGRTRDEVSRYIEHSEQLRSL
jgi:hypothetical protein